ncbi:hypothetical protein CFP56_013815 [Quercus suber]|uniref:Uncharacterized protein n=1 Tax=Quercus suber TaxID=58331 RepID=A0AAW0M4S6_QUESU
MERLALLSSIGYLTGLHELTISLKNVKDVPSNISDLQILGGSLCMIVKNFQKPWIPLVASLNLERLHIFYSNITTLPEIAIIFP